MEKYYNCSNKGHLWAHTEAEDLEDNPGTAQNKPNPSWQVPEIIQYIRQQIIQQRQQPVTFTTSYRQQKKPYNLLPKWHTDQHNWKIIKSSWKHSTCEQPLTWHRWWISHTVSNVDYESDTSSSSFSYQTLKISPPKLLQNSKNTQKETFFTRPSFYPSSIGY